MILEELDYPEKKVKFGIREWRRKHLRAFIGLLYIYTFKLILSNSSQGWQMMA